MGAWQEAEVDDETQRLEIEKLLGDADEVQSVRSNFQALLRLVIRDTSHFDNEATQVIVPRLQLLDQEEVWAQELDAIVHGGDYEEDATYDSDLNATLDEEGAELLSPTELDTDSTDPTTVYAIVPSEGGIADFLEGTQLPGEA